MEDRFLKSEEEKLSLNLNLTNRKKLLGAYSDKSPLVKAYYILEDEEFLITASSGRMLILHTGAINAKTTQPHGPFVRLGTLAYVTGHKPRGRDGFPPERGA